MKKLIFYVFWSIVFIQFACTDQGFTAFKLSIFLENESGHNLNLYSFNKQGIDTIAINNHTKYHYGIFDYDSVLPIEKNDSMIVKFADNKTLRYFPSDSCNQKSIFCNSTYFCISGDTTICRFIIDVEEYLKAK
ncbi:MAG: hypothetical protein ABJC12_12765 [Saprospiraceae bacterium]